MGISPASSQPNPQELLTALLQATSQLAQSASQQDQKLDRLSEKLEIFAEQVSRSASQQDQNLDRLSEKLEILTDQIGRLTEQGRMLDIRLDRVVVAAEMQAETAKVQAEMAKTQAENVAQLLAMLHGKSAKSMADWSNAAGVGCNLDRILLTFNCT